MVELRQTVNESERCKSCYYCAGRPKDRYCQYILVEGEPRGCPGGDECTRYIERRHKKCQPK